MNLEHLNVAELSSEELVEISGGQGGPYREYSRYKWILPITDEDVCRELGC